MGLLKFSQETIKDFNFNPREKVFVKRKGHKNKVGFIWSKL